MAWDYDPFKHDDFDEDYIPEEVTFVPIELEKKTVDWDEIHAQAEEDFGCALEKDSVEIKAVRNAVNLALKLTGVAEAVEVEDLEIRDYGVGRLELGDPVLHFTQTRLGSSYTEGFIKDIDTVNNTVEIAVKFEEDISTPEFHVARKYTIDYAPPDDVEILVDHGETCFPYLVKGLNGWGWSYEPFFSQKDLFTRSYEECMKIRNGTVTEYLSWMWE